MKDFYFDSASVRREARRMSAEAEELKQEGNRLENAMESLSRNWEGNQAGAFLRKGALLVERRRAAAKTVQRLEAEARELVRRVELLEEKNKEIVRTFRS